MSEADAPGASESRRPVSSLKRYLRPIFGTVALAFVGHAGIHLYSTWDDSSVQVDPLLFLLAVIVAGGAMLVQLFAWRALIKHMTGRAMPAHPSARLYLDSQMARYTPGKVGLAVVRIAGAEAVGVPSKIMASALLVEVVSWAGVGSALGGVVLGLSSAGKSLSSTLSTSALVVGVCAMVGLLIVLIVDRRHYPSRLRELAGESSGPLVPWTLPALHLLHFGVWMLSGALVCLAVGGGWEVAVVSGALLCLAIVGGFLALLAPAGAGVREAVMAVGLAPLLGASASVSVGMLTRVASLVSDLVLWGWFRMRARQAEGASDDAP